MQEDAGTGIRCGRYGRRRTSPGAHRGYAPAAGAVVVDIRMPLLNGLDAGRQIKQILGSVKLVFLTMKYGPRFGRRGIPTRSFRLPSENLRGIGTGGGDSGGFEGQVVSLSGNHQGNSRLLAAPGRGIY